MKKFLVGITAAACAAVMCVGLVACGSGANAKDVNSIEVTEAEWTSAFEYFEKDDMQFSMEMRMDSNVTVGDQTMTTTTTGSARLKDNKTYYKAEAKASGGGASGSATVEEYTSVENGTFFVYTKAENGQWVKTENGDSEMDDFMEFMGMKSGFAACQYSAEDKGYVLNQSGVKMVFKFGKVGDDVRLVAVYGIAETGVQKIETNIVLNYGNVADINLPSVG